MQADLRTFFDGIMSSTGASCGPGSSIVTCKISNDKVRAALCFLLLPLLPLLPALWYSVFMQSPYVLNGTSIV
jgi:hypothetical protein